MRIAHRMSYFSVLGILKYGIGWRPQNAPFENCSIWEMFDLRIAPFEKCSIWEMLHLRNVRFENCFIWEMLHLRNVWFENCSIREMLHLRNAPFENCSIWELLLLRNARFEKWGWRQIIHFEKAAISIKKVNSILFKHKQWVVKKKCNVPGNTQRVKYDRCTRLRSNWTAQVQMAPF